jgi:hypothetical protein
MNEWQCGLAVVGTYLMMPQACQCSSRSDTSERGSEESTPKKAKR